MGVKIHTPRLLRNRLSQSFTISLRRTVTRAVHVRVLILKGTDKLPRTRRLTITEGLSSDIPHRSECCSLARSVCVPVRTGRCGQEKGERWRGTLEVAGRTPGFFSHDDTCNGAISRLLSVLDGALTRRPYSWLSLADGHSELDKMPPLQSGCVSARRGLSARCHCTPPYTHCASKYNAFSFLLRLDRKAANPRGKQVSCVPITNPVTGAICCDKVSWPRVTALRGTRAWRAAM